MFTPDVMFVDIHCLFVYSGHSELIVTGRSLRLDQSRGIGEWTFNSRITDLGH